MTSSTTPPRVSQIPTGFRAVPVAPTTDMLVGMQIARISADHPIHQQDVEGCAWRAALDHAPRVDRAGLSALFKFVPVVASDELQQVMAQARRDFDPNDMPGPHAGDAVAWAAAMHLLRDAPTYYAHELAGAA